ncbi:MAG: site-specific DNA-methyltransferase [Stigonema ocellatum SAG 48.90 = DSM 106950]|nr:site-specific DNA-methyltransferase [Stigonema ocellatum SAG 48.90 = DSM 106950]
MPKGRGKGQQKEAQSYKHVESDNVLRPDIGVQPQFRKIKSPATYRYDSSLSPALEWDNNPVRDQTEKLIAAILEADSLSEVKAVAARLKGMSLPFLNWAGKAERLSFDVPTLPLFVHERLSTEAIIETLKGHKKGGEQLSLDLWGDPQHSITDQVLKAYEYRDDWTNRMILGDSLVVMNSLLQYEGLAGQVQTIYIDPPYGVKFGSNFQPFVRKRDVKHNEDEDMTREPEMVQAYRDTWELGLHSYLTYLRDRLYLAKELLTLSGSVFVQISDENLHHVRQIMDEVFGAENFFSLITLKKLSPLGTGGMANVSDYILWYAKQRDQVKFRSLYERKEKGEASRYDWIELPDGSRRKLTQKELAQIDNLPSDWKLFCPQGMLSSGYTESCTFGFELNGTYIPAQRKIWRTNRRGVEELIQKNRLILMGNLPYFVAYYKDNPLMTMTNIWTDLGSASTSYEKMYVVQTPSKIIQRCLLMTTDPSDLVLDPTCGSGTTAYVAEQWGRRWITIDVSRVPLALARQRLLTAIFPWYELKDELRGPVGGFVYKRKQNKKGEEVGGIVPHVTLKSIASNEPPEEEIIVERPEIVKSITRVAGAFTVEATIPTPIDMGEEQQVEGEATLDESASFIDRMLEVLRKSPVLRLEANRTVTFKNVRKPTKSLSLFAEAIVEENPVAFVFGPENGAIVERTVYESAIEAKAKSYTHLYVIGFAIHPNARKLIENCENVTGIAATYVQATPDLLMGDLLKNMKSSQIFSVCGLPDIKIHPAENGKYQVELLGLDVFDPVTMEVDHRKGDNVPAWFLDTDYNGQCFYVGQAFFPKTSAWDNLKKALKSTYEQSLWSHLSGILSAPFEAGDNRQIAVKVIDERGNELLVVKSLSEVS